MTTKIPDLGKPQSFIMDDRIFLGEGLFETLRVEHERPCYPQFHWQRMCQAAMSVGIPFDVSIDMWTRQLIHCIRAAKIKVGGIKVLLSGGRAPRGLDAHGDTSSIVFDAFTYSNNAQALRLVSAPWLRDAKNPVYQLKSVNYLESILARRQALTSGADDALFFNQEQHATETTVANLFIVKKDQIFTPVLADGVLAGITRGRILDLCMNFGLSHTETSIERATISQADAVFVTNALQGIRMVKSFEGNALPVHHALVSRIGQLLSEDEARYTN